MKNFYTQAEVDKIIKGIKSGVIDAVVNSIEAPMDMKKTAEFLSKNYRTFQNLKTKDLPKYLIHNTDIGSFCYASELNAWIKANGDVERAA